MANPRSLIYALYTHWDVVDMLVRQSRELAFFSQEQLLQCIARVHPGVSADEQGTVLRSLVASDVLQQQPRSSDLQLNPYVQEFVRGLTREHELGLSEVLQARVAAIREATANLNDGVASGDRDAVRLSANRLSELFRQITLQLDQDKHAILELAEQAKAADSQLPASKRYRQVLDAYDQYVEPMQQMMDPGPAGTFYRYLEAADQALDQAASQLAVQGALYTSRLQLRYASHQAKELRRSGRLVAQQCADTLLPLRDEIRQHNTLSSAIGHLLGQVRKRGLRRTFVAAGVTPPLPLWRGEKGFRLYLGDEIRSIMAAALQFQPSAQAFPEQVALPRAEMERIDEAALRQRLQQALPVDDLLLWLKQHYGQLQDATLLRLFHDLLNEPLWQIDIAVRPTSLDLHTVRVHHHPCCLKVPTP